MTAEVDDWMQAFQTLPTARREALRQWFSTQELIIEHSGQSASSWYQLIQWAMEHPGDYSFVEAFPAPPPDTQQPDRAERGDATEQARVFVGGEAGWAAPATEAISDKARSEEGLERELFARFMAGRLGGR